MDLGTALIGAIFLGLVFLPVALMMLSKNKKQKALLQLLHNAAQQYGGKVTKHEFIGDFAIGIDQDKGFVFYVKKTEENVLEEFVNLREMKSCNVVNMSKSDGSYKTIQRLELCFKPLAKNRSEINLSFFDAGANNQINEELKSIESWSRLINDYFASSVKKAS